MCGNKSTHSGFDATFLHSLLRLVKWHSQSVTAAREECNKYDVIAAPCF